MRTIPTNVTANYCHNWTLQSAIREACQNVVYGSVKSEMKPILQFENGVGVMEDSYTGFEKRHLFFGESEQRKDEDGLGNFGEGWKMFLLICARENVKHKVDTVGFSFYGRMVDTEYDVQSLEIVVEDNERTVGTRVELECNEEEFKRGTQGFAVVQGIKKEDLGEATLIPERNGELYIKGIRIETSDSINPLQLKYSYSIKSNELTNRDRTTVEMEKTYEIIRTIWATQTDREIIKEFVQSAYNGDISEDVQRGVSYYSVPYDMRQVWQEEIAELHRCKIEQLVLSSRNTDIDVEAEYRNYIIAKMPDKWGYFLQYLGFKNASEVVKIKMSEMTQIDVKDLTDYERQIFKRAKIDAKNALKLRTIKDLPLIKIVEEIKDPNGVTDANGMYERDTQTVYIVRDRLMAQRYATKTLVHECNHWFYGGSDNTSTFTSGWEEITVNLLGH
jgi:hypothetical protein